MPDEEENKKIEFNEIATKYIVLNDNDVVLHNHLSLEELAGKIKGFKVKHSEPEQDFVNPGGFFSKMSKPFKGMLGSEEGEPVGSTAWEKGLSKEMLVWYPRTSKRGDYSEYSQHVGWVHYHNIQDLLARFFLSAHETHGRIPNWREMCIGISSRVNRWQHPKHEPDWHMPMFDYDGKNIKTKVKKDVKKLQKEFGLGDATVYTTRNGLHVYFFSDMVPKAKYFEMLEEVDCCKGFVKVTQRNGFAVLRLSAKYTDFDIAPYKVIISPNRTRYRPGRKAAVIKALLHLGQECGTHFASCYPQWASYREDQNPWKVAKGSPGKRVRKISKEEYIKQAVLMEKKEVIKRGKMKRKATRVPVRRYERSLYYGNLYQENSKATTTSSVSFNFEPLVKKFDK